MAQLSDDGYRRVAESSGVLARGSRDSLLSPEERRAIQLKAHLRVQEEIFLGWSGDYGYPRPTPEPLYSALHVSPYRGRR